MVTLKHPFQETMEKKLLSNEIKSLCRSRGVSRLELFGSVARGEADANSDVDLIVTFKQPYGLEVIDLQENLSFILAAPVDLLTNDMVQNMRNPVRKASIIQERTAVYEA